MEETTFSYERLRDLAATVDARRGWDFSAMRTERQPVPWEYLEIVRRYVQPTDSVLDVGTGGGEKLDALASFIGAGVGIDPDPDMIQVARENARTTPTLSFREMAAEALDFPDATFDVVLTRHAPVCVPEVTRLLKPGGFFVSQQVGARNMGNIREAFGTGSDELEERARIEAFRAHRCQIVATGDYDVAYWVKDVPSLLFWFTAIAGANEVPADFSIDRHWQVVRRIIEEHATPRGIATNEHRTLLIVQNPREA